MITAPLESALLAAIYTLTGIALATSWFDGRPWTLWVAVAVAIVLAVGLAPIARTQITRKPVTARRIFESYSWVNGLLTAVATCATVIVTIEFTGLAGADDPQKEIVGQISAALTALIGGIVVATKDTDEALGKRMAKEFQAQFTMKGQERAGKVTLKPDSASLLAVFTKYENGWTDWSRDNRVARIKSLQDNLASDRT